MRYPALAAVTVAATLALIAIGAIVRTTGSGLGCPDWPLCHGRWLPPAEKTAIIEYSHRTAASVVGVLIVATVAVTLRVRRDDRALRWLALAALPLLAFQAWLGKETVERELPPAVVTFHLATALALLGVLTALAAFALLGTPRAPARAPRRALTAVTVGGALVTFAVLLSGAYVVGGGASTACIGWPECPEARVPFLDGARAQHIHWLHRLAVVAGGTAVAWVGHRWYRLPAATSLERRAALLLVTLYGAQVLIGAANVWTDFAEWPRVAHLAAGAAIWALLVLLAIAARYEPTTTRAHARDLPAGVRA
jgi:heme A synthase